MKSSNSKSDSSMSISAVSSELSVEPELELGSSGFSIGKSLTDFLSVGSLHGESWFSYSICLAS